ncbi:MAG: succinylglutamate desuccinylase/aspartoacylase family protein [Verrucomicrobia bacterium]|nr:succinylglutamate desuccinylase/aspartoacylase family protein [Verrucomicrobiota bacterium]
MNLRTWWNDKTRRGGVLLAAAVLVAAVTGRDFVAQRKHFAVHRGPGVTQVWRLSDFLPSLAGTRGDTEVFVLAGRKPGATVLVMGGIHANEPAGHVAAVTLVESAVMEAGRLIVIPTTNASGFTAGDPQEANPPAFSLATRTGLRWFRYGGRGSAAVDQWPDPDIYLHHPSGQSLSGNQTRNMNRAFPGRADGNFTERCAFAVTELVRREKVDLVIDLHEASPEYPVINTIVAHERAMALAVSVAMGLELRGIKIGLEASPPNLRGLSHRELGDHTPALAVLMETANAAEGRIRGRMTPELIVTGRDKMYVKAAKAGRLFVSYDERGHPLEQERVLRHLAGIEEFMKAWTEENKERPLLPATYPEQAIIEKEGLAPYLRASADAL